MQASDADDLVVAAPGRPKTADALLLAARGLGLSNVRIDAAIDTTLPVAKGMGSSTADIVAALRAFANALDVTYSAEALALLATSVEPSDGVMYDDIVALDHHSGQLLERWPAGPAFSIAAFVPADRHDTEREPTVDRRRQARRYADLLERLDRAMREGRRDAIAAVATESAGLNQEVHPNPLWPLLSPHARRGGAMGLCVGHSGTVAGLLFAPGPTASRDAQRAITELLPRAPAGTDARVLRMRCDATVRDERDAQ